MIYNTVPHLGKGILHTGLLLGVGQMPYLTCGIPASSLLPLSLRLYMRLGVCARTLAATFL